MKYVSSIKNARLRKTPVIMALIAALVVPAVVRANAEEEPPIEPVIDVAVVTYVDTLGNPLAPTLPLDMPTGELGSEIVAEVAPEIDGYTFESVQINGEGTEDDVFTDGDDTVVYVYAQDAPVEEPQLPEEEEVIEVPEEEVEEQPQVPEEEETVDEVPVVDPALDVSNFMAFANAEHPGDDDTVASYAFVYKRGIKSLKVTYTDGYTVYVATGDFSTLKVIDNHRRVRKCQKRMMNNSAYYKWWKNQRQQNDDSEDNQQTQIQGSSSERDSRDGRRDRKSKKHYERSRRSYDRR